LRGLQRPRGGGGVKNKEELVRKKDHLSKGKIVRDLGKYYSLRGNGEDVSS